MGEITKKAVPPYATYQSFLNFINGLRENGYPGHITRSMLPGSNSGKAAMSATLSYLGLVTDNDEPTERLAKLANAKRDYGGDLKEILLASYPFFADKSLDLANTTTDKVVQRVKELGAGGSTITKCVAFLLSAAKDASLPVSRYVKTPQVVRTNGKRRNSAKQIEPIVEPPTPPASQPRLPEDKERIVVSVHGMEEWEIFVPKGLSDTQWAHGLKMAKFILDNYRPPASADE